MNEHLLPPMLQKWLWRPDYELILRHLRHSLKLAIGAALTCICLSGCGGGGGGNSGSSSNPDGDLRSSIVFESNRDGDFEILRMNEDGSNVVRVTDNSVTDGQPSRSQDGRQVVFVSNRTGNNEIFVIDAQGTRQLTRNTFDDNRPHLSPDGRRVVFKSTRNKVSDLFILDIDTKVETQLTSSFDFEEKPVWTNDGHIIFTSNAVSDFFQISQINVSGGPIETITEPTEFNQLSPSISPNNNYIAFVSDTDGNSDIYLFNRATKTTTQLTEGSRNNTKPVFSTDGQRLLFSSNRAGNDDIYSMNLDGSDVRNLTRNPAIDRSPDVR